MLGLAGDGVAEAFGEALQAEGAARLVLGEAGALHRHVVSDVGNAKGIPADVHHLGDFDDVAFVGQLVHAADLHAVGLHRLLEPLSSQHVPLTFSPRLPPPRTPPPPPPPPPSSPRPHASPNPPPPP